MRGSERRRARHRSNASVAGGTSSSPKRPLRAVWSATALVAGVVCVGLVSTGGTYALWNSSTAPTTAVVSSGTAALSVGAVQAMDVTLLGPGQSTTGTFTLTNSGSVDLAMRVTGSTTTTTTLLSELTVKLASVARAADCRAGLGGYTARPTAFDTGSGYFTLPKGATATGCLVITLDSDAPASLQSQSTSVGLVLTGTQVGP